MKKYFKLALVGVLGLGLLSTSCKKKNDEPTPPVGPVDPNGGGTNNGGGGTNTDITPSAIVLKLKDGATEFTVEKVVGTELKITGANERTLAKGKITAAPGATIQIEGKLDTLSISSASFASTDFSAAKGLRYLRMAGYTGGDLKASGLSALKSFILSFDVTATVSGIDFSESSLLERLVIQGPGGVGLGEISLPLNSSLSNLTTYGVNVTKFNNLSEQKKLKRFAYGGGYYPEAVYDLSQCAELEELYAGVFSKRHTLILGDKPKLRSIALHSGVEFQSFVLTNAPLLKDYNGVAARTYLTYVDYRLNKSYKGGLEGILNQLGALDRFVINRSSITKILGKADGVWSWGSATILDLRDNQIATADFSGYPNVKELHLQGNKLTAQAITDLIATLPTHAAGTAKIYLNKASGETNATVSAQQTQALAAKGWVVTAP